MTDINLLSQQLSMPVTIPISCYIVKYQNELRFQPNAPYLSLDVQTEACFMSVHFLFQLPLGHF